MISLFIDTSMVNVSISIIRDGKILSIIQEEILNEHSKYATSYVKRVIDEAGIDANDVDNLLVVNGPGSFTGVRIAVTIAKTIAYCLNIPIKTIDALTILAVNVEADRKIVSIEDRNGAFVGEFDKECLPVKDYQYLNKSVYLEYKNNNDVINECDIDYEKVYDYLYNVEAINPHEVKPLYVKGISVLNDK